MKRWLIGAITLLLFAHVAPAETIRVSVAVSLREAAGEIAQAYREDGGDEVALTFGASGPLATQITLGADVDAFISAADTQVEELEHAGLAGPRVIVATNRLVLVVPANTEDPPGSFESLAGPKIRRIAIGDPRTVPAGNYAMQVLTQLKIAPSIRDRLVYGANARQVLAYVESGDVPAGIVYATDAKQAGDQVKVVAIARPADHSPIVYPGVVINTSKHQDVAARFLAYFKSDRARQILSEHGFGVDVPPTTEAAPSNPWGSRESFWPTLTLSLRVASVATLLTAALAVPLAYVMARRRFWGQGFVEGCLLLPLVLPPTVVGYMILAALSKNGYLGRWLGQAFDYSIVFRFEGAVLAAAIVALPMLYMPAKAAFQTVDHELEDISRTMGANRLQVFWHVSLPMARRGLASGLILAFARAIGEFGATIMVFGWQSGRVTLPISIYSAYERGDMHQAFPAVLALSGMSLSLVLGYNYLIGKRG